MGEKKKEEEKVIVYTEGTWDLFHWGHVSFLVQCMHLAGEGGRVIVAVNSDKFTTSYKGKPVINEAERLAMIQACRCVNEAFICDRGKCNAKFILKYKPDIVAIGSDWEKRDLYKQYGLKREWFRKHKIKLVYIPYTPNISTTIIRERIKNVD